MRHIICNIMLVFFVMLHHSTTDAQSEVSYSLEDSTLKGPLRYDVPNSGKPSRADSIRNNIAEASEIINDGSFHERLADLPNKVVKQLVTNGEEIGKGLEKTLKGHFLEGTIQSLSGIAGLFKDGLTNTKHLIFGDN